MLWWLAPSTHRERVARQYDRLETESAGKASKASKVSKVRQARQAKDRQGKAGKVRQASQPCKAGKPTMQGRQANHARQGNFYQRQLGCQAPNNWQWRPPSSSIMRARMQAPRAGPLAYLPSCGCCFLAGLADGIILHPHHRQHSALPQSPGISSGIAQPVDHQPWLHRRRLACPLRALARP